MPFGPAQPRLGASFATRAVLALALSAGCSSRSPKRPIDAGADAGEDAGGDAAIVEPDPPELPVFAPCPPGWREVQDGLLEGLVRCDPWPEGGPIDCEGAEAHFPGGPGCERIGTACPEGDWADDLPEDATVVFVRAGEPGRGDGTRARPYGRIMDAVLAAPDGAVVAISKGTFREEVVVRRPLTLWGACVAQTILDAPSPSEELCTVTLFESGGSAIRNLGITGTRCGIWALPTAAPVEIESVLIDDSVVSGLWVSIGTEVTARDFVVRDTAPGVAGMDGFGVFQENGSTLTLDRVALERNLDVGMLTKGELVGSDIVVRGTLPREADGLFGHGLQVSNGSETTLERAVFEENRTAGILVMSAGTVFVGRDVVVRATRDGICDLPCAFALVVEHGARAEVERFVSEGNGALAVGVIGEASLTGVDFLVARTRSSDEGLYGYGMQVNGASLLDLDRAAFVENRVVGILAFDPGTTVLLDDLVVDRTLEQACAEEPCTGFQGGCGMTSLVEANVTVSRFRISRSALVGVQVADDGGLDLHGGLVEDNLVGANVQDDDFDLRRIQDRVLYRDNVRTLDASSMTLPAPFGGF